MSIIRSAFPENGLRSRIIFTTRNDNVAKSVGPGKHILRLDPLGEDDSWALFCKKAFWTEFGHCCPVELEELARAIMRKCEGLPLAIVAIGGLLCSRNKTAVEWKKTCDSLTWELSNNPALEGVKGILSLRFNDNHMLSCIRELPCLAFLELKNACRCRTLHFNAGGFPKLNKMRLLDLVELSVLRLEKDTLPNIKDLNLIRCREMRSSLQGIEHLTSLQKLYLEEFPTELVERLRSNERANVRHINTISLVYLSGQSRVIETLF